MELAYLVERPVGIYEPNDVAFVAKLLAKDEDAGSNAGRLSLFSRCIATPLAWGALVEIIRETDDWSFCRVIEGGPPGPFHILPDHLATVPAFVKSLKGRDLHRGPLPHERIPHRPRVEPPIFGVEYMESLPPKPRRKAPTTSLLSLDDTVPEWAA